MKKKCAMCKDGKKCAKCMKKKGMAKKGMAKKGDGMWIQGAIKHPGALHEELHVPAGKKIPKSKLAKAAKAKGKEGKRARLAMTLSKLHKKK